MYNLLFIFTDEQAVSAVGSYEVAVCHDSQFPDSGVNEACEVEAWDDTIASLEVHDLAALITELEVGHHHFLHGLRVTEEGRGLGAALTQESIERLSGE